MSLAALNLGVGGYRYFRDAEKKPQIAFISVKGDDIKSGDVHDLKGTIEREEAANGQRAGPERQFGATSQLGVSCLRRHRERQAKRSRAAMLGLPESFAPRGPWIASLTLAMTGATMRAPQTTSSFVRQPPISDVDA